MARIFRPNRRSNRRRGSLDLRWMRGIRHRNHPCRTRRLQIAYVVHALGDREHFVALLGPRNPLHIWRHSRRRELSIRRIEQIEPRPMRIVIHPHRIRLVIVLLLLTRRLRVAHQNCDVLSIRRYEVPRDVRLHRFGFRCIGRRRRFLRRRNRIWLL